MSKQWASLIFEIALLALAYGLSRYGWCGIAIASAFGAGVFFERLFH